MGHVCTTEVRRFRSPLLRALLLKGHAYKAECGEETLLKELSLGLDGYINFKTRGNRDLTSANFERWKMAILRRVQEELRKGDHPLYPQGDTGRAEVQRLQEHLVFLKEDRAPHVIVGMCKYRYMLERERYLTQSSTFKPSQEDEKAILDRHWKYHEDKGLACNNRLPYIYGIWKSAKRNLRWISGARKGKEDENAEGP